MFCQKCGIPCNNSSANFCNSCGASLKELTTNTNASLRTLSFEKFLKTRKESNLSISNDPTFQDLQKRKSTERSKSIKKKKEEIVKV